MATVWAIVRYQHIGLRRRNRPKTGTDQQCRATQTQRMYVSSLAHVLSISGYHMAVVAGIVFFFIRAILSDRDSSLGRRVALWGVREVCGLLLASLVAGFATSRSTNAPENPPRVKRRRDRRLSRGRLIPAEQPNQLALDTHTVGRQDTDLVGGVGRFKRDRSAAAAKPL
jgi:Competence protein